MNHPKKVKTGNAANANANANANAAASAGKLRLVLGDQLNPLHSWFAPSRKGDRKSVV